MHPKVKLGLLINAILICKEKSPFLDSYKIKKGHWHHFLKLSFAPNSDPSALNNKETHCFFYNYEYPQKGHLLILVSKLARDFRESFFRKVSVCTLTDLNPGFDGPWKKLWICFVNGTFIMPQKESFGQKLFWISCTGSKVPFW